MNLQSFKIQFATMLDKFGNENFNSVTATELWNEFKTLDEKIAVSVFEWARDNFKKTSPTIHDLLKKAKAIEFIEAKRQENLNLGPDPRLVTTTYDELLKKLGTKSLAEALALGKRLK